MLRSCCYLTPNKGVFLPQASTTPVSGISLPDDTLLTSLYNSDLILRQKEMHFFLKKFLQLYSSSCIDEFPKELLQGLENLPLSEKS
jgi:hypothetical protein